MFPSESHVRAGETGEGRAGNKEKAEEVANKTKLIDFPFSGDHSAQPSVRGGFRVPKRRDDGRVTPGAGALQTRPSEKRQPHSLDARRGKRSQSSPAATSALTSRKIYKPAWM